MEVAVQAQDVLVPEVALDLHLSPQLVLHAGLAQLGLEQHLHRAPPWKLSVMAASWAYTLHWPTFKATTCLLVFSRAMYTLPKLPLPSGLPMSKSSRCHRLVAVSCVLPVRRRLAA